MALKKIVKIALFEDDSQDVLLLRELLENTNETEYKISHFNRLQVGLSELDCRKYSVIITDLNLPDSNGFNTFKSILDTCSSLPIILNDNQAFAVKSFPVICLEGFMTGL